MGAARESPGGGVLSRLWVNVVVTAVGYFALSLVGNQMLPRDGISLLWPASGFAAVMLLWAPGRRGRAATIAAVAIGYAAFAFGTTEYGDAELAFVVANALEPLIMLPFLLRATADDHKLASLRGLGWFVAGASVACMASAVVATAGIIFEGSSAGAEALWRDWFVGDALGILVLAPLLLQARPIASLWRRGTAVEQVALWAALGGSLLLLVGGSEMSVVVLGVVVLIAVLLDTAAASLAILASSVVMALLAQHASVGENDWTDVRLLIAIVVLVGQAVSLATSARVRALGERDQAVQSALAAVRRSEATDSALRDALDAGLDAFVILRPDGDEWRVAFANEPARSPSGMGPDAVVGTSLADLLPAGLLPVVDGLLQRAAVSTIPVRTLSVVGRPDLGWHGTVELVAARSSDRQVVVTWRDVSGDHAHERTVRAASAAAMHAATHDSLTNLPNRMLFEDRFRHIVGGLSRSDDAVAVILTDIDGFQTIVDRHGVATADAVLIEFAGRLESLVRAQDTVARVGSDEFELILGGLTSTWGAADFFDRLTAEASRAFQTPSGELTLSVSSSYLLVSEPSTEPNAVRERLFATLRHGRTLGPGQTTESSDDLGLAALWSPAAEDIAAALRENQFRLAYQPVIEVVSGAVVGQEALIRWNHPEHGPIGPDQFIGVAESAGLMVDIGDWVLRQALADQVRQPPGTWTSINVSSAQLVRRDLVSDVSKALAENGIDAGSLVLELVESQLLHATPTTLGRLASLREHGVRIALDDFGSGYSSLSYLQDFAVDIVKLDRALIDGALDERRLRFLRWLADLAPTTGVTMIVEGVETSEQRDMALAAGLQFAQGYLWARPAFLDDGPEVASGG